MPLPALLPEPPQNHKYSRKFLAKEILRAYNIGVK